MKDKAPNSNKTVFAFSIQSWSTLEPLGICSPSMGKAIAKRYPAFGAYSKIDKESIHCSYSYIDWFFIANMKWISILPHELVYEQFFPRQTKAIYR